MLHLVYILAFTTLAFIAVGNLIRNLILIGSETTRNYPPKLNTPVPSGDREGTGAEYRLSRHQVPHPEFLDEEGMLIREPLLVMRSITVEDAREKLDALYNASSTGQDGQES